MTAPLQPDLPYRAAGLTERQAAAHLLDRFAFGPTPGAVDRVVEMGLERWLDEQLRGDLPEPELDRRLAGIAALSASPEELAETYASAGYVRTRAFHAGIVDRNTEKDDKAARRRLLEWAYQQGFRHQRELIKQIAEQKLVRAVYAQNQLREVLTDFWFNHFNVLWHNETSAYLLDYEYGAIRPNVFGPFRAVLGATAKHPAMLRYLDNARSFAPRGRRTAADLPPNLAQRRPAGLNENYARELLELHTLGVDGGYTQEDVEETARALTGWLFRPVDLGGSNGADKMRELIEMANVRGGGVVEGEGRFVFVPALHDAEAKTILGTAFPAGGGLDEGERVLDLVAEHPSTAQHLAWKLARKFVQDDPPDALVDRMAGAFGSSGGDVRVVLREMVQDEAFWAARRAKMKSPFELTASALRALDAEVQDGVPALQRAGALGEAVYLSTAPTGYPDHASAWISAGTLLQRVNFGLALATGGIGGVRADLLALNGGHEPASPEEALEAYAAVVLPARETADTVRLLLPTLRDPDFDARVAAAADGVAPPEDDPLTDDADPRPGELGGPESLGRVVGLLLGAPEFQRQ